MSSLVHDGAGVNGTRHADRPWQDQFEGDASRPPQQQQRERGEWGEQDGGGDGGSDSDGSEMTAIVVSSPLEGIIGLPATLQAPIHATARPTRAARARRGSVASVASALPSEAGLESVVSWIDGLQVRTAKRPYRAKAKRHHEQDIVWRLCMEFSNPGKTGPERISIVWGPVSGTRQQAEAWAASLIALRKLRRRLRGIAVAWAKKAALRIAKKRVERLAAARIAKLLAKGKAAEGSSVRKPGQAPTTGPAPAGQRRPPPPPPRRAKQPQLDPVSGKLPHRRPPPPPRKPPRAPKR
jgi:hypothetical protein